MGEKAGTVLFNAHTRWPNSIEIELWTLTFRHEVNQWNITPIFDLAYETLDKIRNGLKRQTDAKYYFKTLHLYRYPVYGLNNKLQDKKS